MENIIETILAYIQTQDLYTVISLGVLFALVFAIVIYKKSQKPTTRYLGDIQEEDIYDDDVFDDDPDNFDNSPTAQNTYTPTQMSEGGSRMTWFIIDGVAILTFTVISYVLVLKNMWRDEGTIITIVQSIGYNIIFYYAFIKSTLFNTKPKK